MKPTLLILAAGMGSRYGGLKQLDTVGPSGETIMDYSIFDALRAGFKKVVFVIRTDFEQEFKEKIAAKWSAHVEVDFAFQGTDTFVPDIQGQVSRQKPWGTGHAVLVAKQVVTDPFVVINADDYYGRSGFMKMHAFLTGKCSELHFAMVGYILKNTLSDHGAVSRGVCEMDENFILKKITECTGIEKGLEPLKGKNEEGIEIEIPSDSLVSMNLWGFHPHIFTLLQKGFDDFVQKNFQNPKAEFYISSFANRLIHSKTATFSVLPTDEKWYGVTYQEDKEPVKKAFQELTAKGIYPSPLWNPAV